MSAVGAVFRAESESVESAELAAIADAGSALGPAAGGLVVETNVGLAHRRSEGERPQPVGDGDHLLVADARLDNRRELARSLGRPQAGAAGDTELLLAAYKRWGEDCLAKLVGDFAFVLWDIRRRRLLCVRDALGVRPLHYARAGGALVVASEAQQLLAHPDVPRRLDRGFLADYLLNRCPEQGATMFQEVRTVPPGHALIAGEAAERLVRFWNPEEIEPTASVDGEEAADRFLELFDRAVGDRLVDCGSACGVLLSGGLDSSSVAVAAAEALAAKGPDGRLALYNCTFDEHLGCDEGLWVTALSDRLGLSVERIPAEPGWLVPGAGMTSSPESPFIGWQSLLHQALRRLRLRGGRVLLTGHGGDAVAAGSALVYADRLRRGDLGVLSEISAHAAASGGSMAGILRHWGLRPLLPTVLQRGLAARRSRATLPDWFDVQFARQVGLAERQRARPATRGSVSHARSAMRAQIERLDSALRVVHWSQRFAASQGIEVRHPFLDRRLVELVLATPPRLLFRAGRYKQLLRSAMADRLPAEIRERRGKAAFGPYLDSCWRETGARAIGGLLRSPMLAELGIVSADRVRSAYRSYLDGHSVSVRGHLWAIMTLELWLRQHAGGTEPLALGLGASSTGEWSG